MQLQQTLWCRAVPTAGSVKIDGANKTDALAGTLAAR